MLHPGLGLGDRYRLDARIGAGGMGEVWRAVDEVLGRVVAVKAMLPEVAGEPGFARRFLAEAKAMASVNHPAVASIHDYGRSDGVTFLVMEFIDGESLSQVLGRLGRLAPADVMRLVAQAADGLQAVHDCGIVHRDIKPANLLIRRNGTLLITDFGISRTQDGTHLTASGAVLGTPTYLSPEQVLGQPATALSDIYSLGLAAYECLAGFRPFEGDNPYAVALQRVQTAPRTLSADIPRDVLAVVEGALATDPAHRWPSATALADAARAAARTADSASASTPAPRQEPPQNPAPRQEPPRTAAPQQERRRRRLIVAGLLVVVVAVGTTAWTVSRGPGKGAGPAAGADPARSSAPAPEAVFRQAGLTSCGDTFCPTAPQCWDGLYSASGKTTSPRPVDCAEPHYWETFAAVGPPADVAANSEDALMERADIAAACSTSVMAAHSRDGSHTRKWDREAWLIDVPGTNVRLVHCLGNSNEGETSGSVFTA